MLTSVRFYFVVLISLAIACAGAQSPWSSSTSYPTSSLVIGSDTNLYRALTTTIGNNPTTDSGSNWVLYTACAATTLPVSSGGRFTTLTQAYAFVQDATITHNGLVTISIAAGYTTTEPGPVTFSNPYGQRISVVGGGTTSVLNFGSAFNGIVVQAGCSLGNLSGVSLHGPIVTAANFTTYVSSSGIFCGAGGEISIGTISTNGWDVGVFTMGGAIVSEGGTVLSVNNCGDEGIEALERGLCFVPGAQVGTINNFAQVVTGSGLGFGFACGYGSFIWCPNSSVSSSTIPYFARTESGIYAYNVTPGTYTSAAFAPSVNTYMQGENAFIDSNWVLGQGGGGIHGGGCGGAPPKIDACSTRLQRN